MIFRKRRSTHEMHPNQLGCMLAVLTAAGIVVAVIAWQVAYALFSWRFA